MNLTMRKQPGVHGVLTHRFYDQLVEQRDSLQCWADNLLECADAYNETAVSSGMASFDPDANVDCWVRTEMFDDDVKRCLVEYEQRSGAMLNWVAFDKRVPDMNKAGHSPCKDFFAAKPGLESKIMHADRELAQAFHYPSCCAPPLSARLQRGYAMEDNVVRPAGVPTDAEPEGAILVRSSQHAAAELPPRPRGPPAERTAPRLNVSRSTSRRHVSRAASTVSRARSRSVSSPSPRPLASTLSSMVVWRFASASCQKPARGTCVSGLLRRVLDPGSAGFTTRLGNLPLMAFWTAASPPARVRYCGRPKG